MNLKSYLFVITFLLLPMLFLPVPEARGGNVPPRILILNSYHLGYLWSDGEVNGVENTIKRAWPDAYIAIEYLDTKRTSPDNSHENLCALYKNKYKGWRFDLIVSVDDNALTFLKKYRHQLFGDVPVVFCGVNNFKPEMLAGFARATGVTEIHRIADNLELMTRLHPGLRKVTVVTDVTVSGQISLQEVRDALPPFAHRLNFEFLVGMPLPELENHLSRQSPDSVVFLLNYFRDHKGNYYSPETVMPRISQASPVPVYCFSEFYLNHGVTGGIINEGYPHGVLAGKIALKVLAGEDPARIAVVEGPMQPVFDYRQMLRFGLKPSALSPEATILNLKQENRKDILIIHSYDPEFVWTANITKGLKDVLRQRQNLGELFIEYMDTKRFFSKLYRHQLYELYRGKYANRSLDLILTTDDNAFDFVREYRSNLFKDTPIVFCGVNYLENPEAIHQKENLTGVLESFDLPGSINAILKIEPAVEQILIINDHTTTGVKMQRKIGELVSRIKAPVRLRFLPPLGMKELLLKLADLDQKTAVLFLNFYVDGNNIRYNLEESVRAITSACNRPVYSMWEFTLGFGVIGGSMAYGYDQGALAARLGSRILEGEKASQVALVKEHPYRYFFDHEVLTRFKIPPERLPKGSTLINNPVNFWKEHRTKVIIAALLFSASIVGLFLQQCRIRSNEKRTARMQKEARIDTLTGTIVRNYFAPEVEKMLTIARDQQEHLVLCLGDINGLKYVNDTFGHKEGDHYLATMARLLQAFVRSSDRVYRVGGDEFVIVFPHCTAAGADQRLHSIRQEIARLNQTAGCRYLQGISFGCAEFDPVSPKNLQQMMEEADMAMYREKNQKRFNDP